mgnify:CR=1 FL=1
MKNIFKVWFNFGCYSLFFFTVISCLMGILLTIFHVVGIIKNFDLLLMYYAVASFNIWLLTLPLLFFIKVKKGAFLQKISH